MINLAEIGPMMLKLAQTASTPPSGGASPFGMPSGGLAGIMSGKSAPKGLLGMLNNGMQPQGNPFPTPIGGQETGSNANPFPAPVGSPFPKPISPRREYAPAPRPRPMMASASADATGPGGLDPAMTFAGPMPAGPTGIDPAMVGAPPMPGGGLNASAAARMPGAPADPMAFMKAMHRFPTAFGSLAPGGMMGGMMPPQIPL